MDSLAVVFAWLGPGTGLATPTVMEDKVTELIGETKFKRVEFKMELKVW